MKAPGYAGGLLLFLPDTFHLQVEEETFHHGVVPAIALAAHAGQQAYSCKGRGVCPSCNTRRMLETAAHLADHVIPRLPVRQWVLSVPKRLRHYLQADSTVQNLALHIFLSAVEKGLRAACLATQNSATVRIGAVAFIASVPCSIHMCIFTAWWSMGCLRPAPRPASPCGFTKRQRSTRNSWPTSSAMFVADSCARSPVRSTRTGGRRGNGRLGTRWRFQP